MAAKNIVMCLISFCSLKNVFNLPCSRSLEKLCLALLCNKRKIINWLCNGGGVTRSVGLVVMLSGLHTWRDNCSC